MRRRDKNIQSMKRLFPSASAGDMASGRDKILQRLHAEVPELIADFRFRADLWNCAESLRPDEQLFLTALCLLRGEGSTLAICNKIEELISKPFNLGRLHYLADRLEDQGLITSELRQAGKYPRRYCTITEFAKQVLAHAAPAKQAVEHFGHFA